MLGHSPGPTPGSCTRRGSRRAQGGLAGRAGLLHAGLPKDRAGPRPFTLGTPTVGGWSSPLSARARSRPRPAASLQAGRSDPGRPHPGGGQPARGPVPSGGLESGRGAGADTGPAQASCSAAPAGPARVPAHPRALTHLCGPTGRAWPTQRGSGSLPEASCRGWVGTRARQGLRPRLGSGRAALGQGAGSWHSYKRPPPRPPKKPGASAGRGPLRQGRHARVRGQSTEGLRGHQQHLSCPPLASALPWGRRPCPQPLAAWGAGCGATSPAFSTTPPSPRSGGRSLGHRHPPTPGNPLGGGPGQAVTTSPAGQNHHCMAQVTKTTLYSDPSPHRKGCPGTGAAAGWGHGGWHKRGALPHSGDAWACALGAQGPGPAHTHGHSPAPLV